MLALFHENLLKLNLGPIFTDRVSRDGKQPVASVYQSVSTLPFEASLCVCVCLFVMIVARLRLEVKVKGIRAW